MVKGDNDYKCISVKIDAVLTEVWRLGTVYSRTPGAFDPHPVG